ncbi:MAG: TraR/DksA C4-type zinc finger protein [Nocardioidaceae bacterium]
MTASPPDSAPATDAVVEAMLDDAESRTRRRLATLTGDYTGIVEASRDSNADDEHDPEGATIAFERSQVGALVQAARLQLDEVAAARRRLAEGRYGTCERCGRQIPAARLAARPVARTCVGCTG